MAELHDQVAIVTGGAGGLGAATARALAEAGAEVVVADVNVAAGREVAADVGGHFVELDARDLASNREMIRFAVETCGGVDLVHLNAGIASPMPWGDEFDLELYRRAMGVNLDGVVFGTQAALPALRARGGGAIVATASLAGLMGVPMDPVYCANKHAVVGWVRAMGEALAGEGIRVNAVCPGFAESAIIDPIRDAIAAGGFKVIPAEDVAAAVVALCASDVTAQCWVVQYGREPIPFEFRRVPGPR